MSSECAGEYLLHLVLHLPVFTRRDFFSPFLCVFGGETIAVTSHAHQHYDSCKDQRYNDKGRTIVLLLLVCACLLIFFWLLGVTGNRLRRRVDLCARLLAISILHVFHFAEFVEFWMNPLGGITNAGALCNRVLDFTCHIAPGSAAFVAEGWMRPPIHSSLHVSARFQRRLAPIRIKNWQRLKDCTARKGPCVEVVPNRTSFRFVATFGTWWAHSTSCISLIPCEALGPCCLRIRLAVL